MTKVLTYHRGTYLNEALEARIFNEFEFLKGFIDTSETGELSVFDFRQSRECEKQFYEKERRPQSRIPWPR